MRIDLFLNGDFLASAPAFVPLNIPSESFAGTTRFLGEDRTTETPEAAASKKPRHPLIDAGAYALPHFCSAKARANRYGNGFLNL